ncbi:MAG: DUF86 domain-containing protein [Armatimonadetes bacterium]|nr:DUF86 domain-containing protein [Armatimonadota bacterium]
MLPEEDRVRLQHMLDAGRAVIRFVQGRSRCDLDTDEMLLFALVRGLEIVGEAAAKVSDTTRQSFLNIPWRLVVGMRNRLIHGYFDVDRDVLWNTVCEDIPPLVHELEQILSRSG